MKTFYRVLAAILVIVLVAVFSHFRFDIPVETLKERYADAQSRYMTLDGMDVHYKVEGQGFPVVLLHGTASSLHTWDGWVPELSKNYKVVRLDLPAFGITGPNANNNYSSEYYVDFLHRFFQTLGIDSFHLAGNSLGGLIAYNYTLEYPLEVGKLILIDAAGYPREIPPPFAFKLGRTPVLNQLMRYISPRYLHEKSIKDVYGNDEKVTDELVTRYYELGLREGNRAALIARMNEDFESRYQEVSQIKQPTLVMWGDGDIWIPPSDAEKFNNDLPNSTLKYYVGVGHVPMEEEPEKTVRDAINFLRD